MGSRDLKSYMMSLDQLDLNYLNRNNLEPGYEHLYKPLWRPNKKTECYKLEIFSDYEVFTPKYKCQVCDIQVPVMYSEDHELGERHRICLEIMDIALERTRRHVKHKAENTSISHKSHTYFCDICTKAVSLERRNKHMSSKIHLDSVRKELFLTRLLSAYVNEDIDINSEEYNIDLNQNELLKAVNKEVNKCEDDFNVNKLLNQEKTNVNDNLKVHVDKSFQKTTFDNVIKEQNYKNDQLKHDKAIMVELDVMNKENYHKNATKIKIPNYLHYKGENNLIPVKTIDGCQVKVHFDNYNGIITKNNEKYCLLCTEHVTDLAQHVMVEKHLRIIAVIVENVHCLRRINDFISHCILCNDLTTHTDTHTTNVEHFAKLNNMLTDLEDVCDNETFDYETIEFYEPIENNDNPIENKELIEDNESDESSTDINFKTAYDASDGTFNSDAKMLTDKSSDIYIPLPLNCLENNSVIKHTTKNENEQTKDVIKPINYQIKLSEDNELICKVCNEIIKDTDTHLSTKGHANTYKNVLEENYILILDGDRFLCELCNCFLLKCYELNHLQAKKHKTHLKRLNAGKEIKQTTDAITAIETPTILKAIKPISLETESENVFDLNNPVLESISDLKNTGTSSSSVETSFSSLIDTMTESVTSAIKSIIGDSTLTSITPAESINSFYSNSESLPPYFCETCKVKVPNSITNITEHNNGANHKKKLLASKKPVQNSKIIDKVFKNQFCQLCNINLSKKVDMATHVQSDEHMKLYDLVMKTNRIWKRIDNMFYCEYCKVDISPFNELEHVNGAKHLKHRKDPNNTVYI